MMEKLRTILLVEDQPDALDSLSLTLEMAGYQTVKAKGGYEALTVLRTWPIDLILSDIIMSNMGGYQLQKLVRETPEWAAIPFFFLTSCRFLSAGEIRYSKAMGVIEYLTKPVRPEELLAAISTPV